MERTAHRCRRQRADDPLGQHGDKVEIEDVGRKGLPSYRVHGVLRSNNTLLLPGGKFTLRDKAEIKKWLNDLGEQGSPA